MNEKLKISINALLNPKLDSEDTVVENLIQLGFEKVEAEKYTVLVPVCTRKVSLTFPSFCAPLP